MKALSNILINASYIMLLVALIFIMINLIKNRCLYSKLLSLEIASNVVIAGIALLALHTSEFFYLHITIAVALIMFLGSVSYAKFIYARK